MPSNYEHHQSRVALLLGCFALIACGPKQAANEADAEDSSDATESSGDPGDGDGDPGDGDGDRGDGDGDGDAGETSETGVFIPDEGGFCSICDPFAQDCPEGEKCVPYPDLGGNCGPPACFPIVDEKLPGEACSVTDMTDDCDESSWCYPAKLELEGPALCIEFCGGTIDDPQCSNPDEVCVADAEVYGEPLGCRPRCDPLAAESPCMAGEACTLGWSGQGDFGCVLASAELSAGETCTSNHECAAGLCVDGLELLDCPADRCCASLCDVLAPDCPAGTECVPVELADDPEPNVGVCRLPP